MLKELANLLASVQIIAVNIDKDTEWMISHDNLNMKSLCQNSPQGVLRPHQKERYKEIYAKMV